MKREREWVRGIQLWRQNLCTQKTSIIFVDIHVVRVVCFFLNCNLSLCFQWFLRLYTHHQGIAVNKVSSFFRSNKTIGIMNSQAEFSLISSHSSIPYKIELLNRNSFWSRNTFMWSALQILYYDLFFFHCCCRFFLFVLSCHHASFSFHRSFISLNWENAQPDAVLHV